MQEKENILIILKETLLALKKGDSLKIKNLSDKTNHTITVYQDPDNVIVAVLVYSIGKIVERENYRKMDGWTYLIDNINLNIKNSIKFLEKDNLDEFRNSLGKIRNSINAIEGSLKDYLNDVFYKAGVNKAFRFYEHGLSSQRTAELLGISLWDLNSYIGQSNIAEAKISESMPVKDRIKTAEEFFK
jgi:hypothetical protein